MGNQVNLSMNAIKQNSLNVKKSKLSQPNQTTEPKAPQISSGGDLQTTQTLLSIMEQTAGATETLTYNGTDNNDTATIKGTQLADKIVANGYGGDDNLSVYSGDAANPYGYDFHNDITLNGGSGNDNLKVFASGLRSGLKYGDTIRVNGGVGDDRVEVYGSNAVDNIFVNGGYGGDKIFVNGGMSVGDGDNITIAAGADGKQDNINVTTSGKDVICINQFSVINDNVTIKKPDGSILLSEYNRFYNRRT